MDSHELQALATFVVRCHGAEWFAATVRQAKALTGDKLVFGAIWDRIVAEAMQIEKQARREARQKPGMAAKPTLP